MLFFENADLVKKDTPEALFENKFIKNVFVYREMHCRSRMNKNICTRHQDLQNETKRSFVAQLVQKL